VETQLGNFPAAIAAGEHALRFGVFRPAVTYVDLARAYKREARYADAKRTIAEAQAQGKDNSALHHILFDIAVIEQDQQAIQHEVEWSEGQPDSFSWLESEAILAADQGRYHQSEALFDSAIRDAGKKVDADFADDMRLDEARIELQLGRTDKVRELLQQIKDRSSVDCAVVEAGVGDTAAAEGYLKKPEQYPRGTAEHYLLLSEVKALLALHRGDPAGAVAALEPAVPYQLGRCEVIEVRAQAYLAAHQGSKAQEQFQILLDHAGLEDPTLPRTNLAHLGLARAYALQNSKTESRNEFEKFFALWKDADADVPVLKQARAEYAHLQ
jgi:tetratricopeptide (TPR) repeat protein